MENYNSNNNQEQGSNYNDSPFYENPKRGNNPNDTRNKPVFSEKNYLNVRLAPGETTRQVKIRILPISATNKKIALPVHIHSLKVDKQVAQSGFKTFLCLNDEHLLDHDSRGCPICNKSQEFFDMANEIPKDDEHASEKRKAFCKEAYKYQPKTAYIVRVIERGKEDEGVKFWRFNHWDNGKGCKDQLENLYKLRKAEAGEAGIPNFNIFDLYEGKDIVLTLTKSQKENSHIDKTEITITDAGMSTPLSKDDEQIQAWVNDAKDWHDMYAFKDFNYLEIVADGGIPVYSPQEGHYVPKQAKEEQDAIAEQEAIDEVRKGAGASGYEEMGTDADNTDNEDDLPF